MTPPITPLVQHSEVRDGHRAMYRSRPHDLQNFYVSLKQWRILHAVIDCGGFAEAARHLHLSQSAISYTIAKLQEQLDVQLLKIEGRRAHLTTAGRALLDRSRRVLKEAIELEVFARHLGQGWVSEVRLAVDQNCPPQPLMHALRTFAALGVDTHVRLTELAMQRTEEVLRDLSVDLAISPRVPMGFLGEPLLEVEYVAVARPDHALFALGRVATAADLERHIQIGIGCTGEFEGGNGDNSHQYRRWNLSSFDTVMEAVAEGLGYAWLPRHRVQHRLEQGSVALLPLGERRACKAMLYLIHGHPSSASPFASRLAEVLRAVATSDAGAEARL